MNKEHTAAYLHMLWVRLGQNVNNDINLIFRMQSHLTQQRSENVL